MKVCSGPKELLNTVTTSYGISTEMKTFPEYWIVSRILQKKYFWELVLFFAAVRGKRVIFVITFDTPASEKTHDDNKKVRMTNLVVMSSQARESQYRSFKVKGLREATTNYLECDN